MDSRQQHLKNLHVIRNKIESHIIQLKKHSMFISDKIASFDECECDAFPYPHPYQNTEQQGLIPCQSKMEQQMSQFNLLQSDLDLPIP